MLILKTVITTFDAIWVLLLLLFLLASGRRKKDEGDVVFTTMFIALFLANMFAMWR